MSCGVGDLPPGCCPRIVWSCGVRPDSSPHQGRGEDLPTPISLGHCSTHLPLRLNQATPHSLFLTCF